MNNNFNYKVVILAAGVGARLGMLTENINKAILPVGFKGVISHILEKFSPEIEIVMALGYEKEKLKEYLSIAHPERKFRYVEVDKVAGIGSGPGYSLLQCKEHLQCPFIFTTVDTIVLEDVPSPTRNWLGVSPVQDTTPFISYKIRDGFLENMKDKEYCDNTHAFIGLWGIYDYRNFWQALQTDKSLIEGELQVSNGLKAFENQKLHSAEFTWFDTGDVSTFKKTRKYFNKEIEDFNFSKCDEYIYFVGNKVIKYFKDELVVDKRVTRAQKLESFVPKIEKKANHFYSYSKIPGTIMYEIINENLAHKFFDWLRNSFWKPLNLSKEEQEIFKNACWRFYHDKTKERVKKYFDITGEKDDSFIVNGSHIPSLSSLLEKIDWKDLSKGMPSIFHGDLQFDNVLVTNDESRPFVLLDWRQDFAGLLDYGDLYYDLAKLNGGLIIPYNLIKKNMFSYERTGNKVHFDIASKYSLIKCRKIYEEFLLKNNYDLKRVKLLTALIFLNMSPLHTTPFNFLLHHLGKLELYNYLK